MIKDIKGIHIKGKNFLNGSNLLFWNDDKRYSFIYGRNGSGKTNVSLAFNSLKNGNYDFEEVYLIYNDNNLSHNDKNGIFIFNENYINEKIRVKENGIGSIVMFGKQVSIDNEIGQLKEKNKKIEQNNIELETKIKRYDDIHEKDSIPSYKKKIQEYAKENWSENYKKIYNKGRSKNLKFEDESIRERINALKQKCNEKFPFDEYTNDDFNKNYNEYDKIKGETEKFADAEKLARFILAPSLIDRFEILSKRISTRSFTERENKIIEIIKHQEFTLEDIKEYVSEDNSICPFCFQTLSGKYKNDLLHEIDNILNEEISNYKTNLKNIYISLVEIDEEILNKYSSCLNYQVAKISKLKKALNNSIKEFNLLVDEKIKNIYGEINMGNIKDSLIANIEDYNKEVAEIDKLIRKYNEDVDKKDEKQKLLSEYNDILLYKGVKDDFEVLEKKEGEYNALSSQLNENKEEINTNNNKIKELNSEKNNTKIAIEKINNMLKFIFFDSKRLVIRIEEDGLYGVVSNGKDVKPEQISTGEKNILALCYFFTEYLRETNEDDKQIDDKILVIDDPVSSFDKENRLGVLSLLKNQIDFFNEKTKHGKILIMTHDLFVYFQLWAIFDEADLKKDITYGRLNNLAFEQDKRKPQDNEYRRLIKDVYNFAIKLVDDKDDISVGNKIRKIFEEFFTFNYGIGLNKFTCENEIIELLPQENQNYFKNFMLRLFLNGSSHAEYQKYAMIDSVELFSEFDKVRSAKSILVLLFKLNELHIIKIFENDKKVIENIKKWASDCVL